MPHIIFLVFTWNQLKWVKDFIYFFYLEKEQFSWFACFSVKNEKKLQGGIIYVIHISLLDIKKNFSEEILKQWFNCFWVWTQKFQVFLSKWFYKKSKAYFFVTIKNIINQFSMHVTVSFWQRIWKLKVICRLISQPQYLAGTWLDP